MAAVMGQELIGLPDEPTHPTRLTKSGAMKGIS